MGLKASKPVPVRGPVQDGKIRVCVAGFSLSHHTGKARKVAETIVTAYPKDFESWFYFDTAGYRGDGGFLPTLKAELSEQDQEKFKNHKSSPFCWLEMEDGSKQGLGGRDNLCEWVAANEKFADNPALKELASNGPGLGDLWVDESHGSANAP
jgi:hypothetical protein